MNYKRSSALFGEAEKVIPGGVNSPVRAFKAVGGDLAVAGLALAELTGLDGRGRRHQVKTKNSVDNSFI